MPSRLAKFTQSDAKRIFKAAVKAGVEVRLEFRPDGTIIATTESTASTPIDESSPDAPEAVRKLV